MMAKRTKETSAVNEQEQPVRLRDGGSASAESQAGLRDTLRIERDRYRAVLERILPEVSSTHAEIIREVL